MKKSSTTRSSFTAAQRGQIVQRVLVDGWTCGETAAAYGLRERLVAVWVADYRRYGMASLRDHPGTTAAAEMLRLLRPVRRLFRGIANGVRSVLAFERISAPLPLRRSRDDRGGGL